MAGKAPIAPILIADKATLAFSAEEGEKARCVYPSWEAPKGVLDGQHLRSAPGTVNAGVKLQQLAGVKMHQWQALAHRSGSLAARMGSRPNLSIANS
jgi:hypothetical protein